LRVNEISPIGQDFFNISADQEAQIVMGGITEKKSTSFLPSFLPPSLPPSLPKQKFVLECNVPSSSWIRSAQNKLELECLR
jgi:hypothetical protein